MATVKPLLDLATFSSNNFPRIRIDGKLYILTPPYALPQVTLSELSTIGQAVSGFGDIRRLKPKKAKEVSALLDRICRLILQAPPAVQAKLSDLQRIQVANAFTSLPVKNALRTTGSPYTRSRRTGARSSRG